LGATGTATISADLSALADGIVVATVALTDRAGNTGAATTVSTWKDATPPAAPTIALDARDDTGASNGDYVTSVRAPRFVVAGDLDGRRRDVRRDDERHPSRGRRRLHDRCPRNRSGRQRRRPHPDRTPRHDRAGDRTVTERRDERRPRRRAELRLWRQRRLR